MRIIFLLFPDQKTIKKMLIQPYAFHGKVVLDPFIGSGQATIAAVKTRRHYVGYDINEEYVKLAERRIKEFSLNFNAPKLFEFGRKG